MSVLVKKYEKELQKFTKKMDELYEDYKYKLGKEIGALPSKRPDFDPCSAKYVRKYLKYIPGEKVKREAYITDMLNVCTTCAVKQQEVTTKKKRSMNSWNCYLKQCAAENNNMNFQECMTNKEHKEMEYIPNKAKYADLAKEGCDT